MAVSARPIARPALARRLSEGLEGGSVLLVAGAGYGKTPALAEALELGVWRTAWLSCAESGGDPVRLLVEVVAAVSAAAPGLGVGVGDAIMSASEPIDVPVATGALVAELDHLLTDPL